MKHHDEIRAGRRGFLRSALVLGTAGAATVALTSTTANAAVAEDQPRVHKPDARKGYRVTPHIAAYYKTASF